MSNIKRVFKTAKGTEIPLLNLKGKDYLQVAHRLIILDETYKSYTVQSEMISVTEESAVVKSTVTVYNDNGGILRQASSTKKETKKDFPDFIEKAETGSIGRALALIGIGTQFCTQDLDEGNRLADSPVFSKEDIKTAVTSSVSTTGASLSTNTTATAATNAAPPKFKLTKPSATKVSDI